VCEEKALYSSVSGRALARHVDEWLDRRHPWLLVLLTLGYLETAVVKARTKPFWHDEIYTILVSGLPSLSSMWRATMDGIDLSPPLNAWMTRAVHDVAGVGHVSTRVPAMVGFWIMLATVFHIVRQRAGTTAALAAALIPFSTAAFRYSYEARSYGLMLALFALGLYAWGEATRGRRRSVHLPLLAVALAAAPWNHYYAVLTFLPIAAGELTRLVQRRRIDVGIATAFAFAGVAILPMRSLIAGARHQNAMFWSVPQGPRDISEAYLFLFEPLGDRRFMIAVVVIALILVVSALTDRDTAALPRRALPVHEVIAGLVALLLPIFGSLLARWVTGAFVPRYFLTTVVSVSLAIPLVLWWLNVRASGAEFVLCAVLVFTFAQSVAGSLLGRHGFEHPVRTRTLLLRSLETEGPTVIPSSLQFLQLWYYAPPTLKAQLRYLADPAEAAKRSGSSTIDQGYLVLARWTSVPVEPYTGFVGSHREFRVYAAGSGWLIDKLRQIGANVQEVGRERGGQLYRVRLESGALHDASEPTSRTSGSERSLPHLEDP
jgi:hypothetical protein